MTPKLLVLGGALLALTTACSTLTENNREISIRHSANNSLFVENQAEQHCAKYGKSAVEVQRTPIESWYFAATVITTFACVEKKERS